LGGALGFLDGLLGLPLFSEIGDACGLPGRVIFRHAGKYWPEAM